MALINCEECRTEISDTALDCPKCGKRLKKLQRSVLGKLIKYSFIGFNILMIYSLLKGMSKASDSIVQTTNEVEKAGAVIGTGLGAMMIVFIWISGDIILGLLTLFTRPKK